MKSVVFIVFGFILLSIQRDSSPFEKFREWYKENGSNLAQKKKVEDYSFELKYIPKEIKVIRELGSDLNLSSKAIQQAYTKYDLYYEFTFSMQHDSVANILMHVANNAEEYNSYLFYLLEEIQQDFSLHKNSGTFKPLRCSFENNYGVTPFLKFHLVFEKEQGDQLLELVYNDLFVGSGEIRFDISSIDDLKIPKIK